MDWFAPLGGLRGFEVFEVNFASPRQRFEILMLLWAFGGFFLFSKSSTKFHRIPAAGHSGRSVLKEDIFARKHAFDSHAAVRCGHDGMGGSRHVSYAVQLHGGQSKLGQFIHIQI